MNLYILWTHIIFASIFTIYIMVDRLYIRNFIQKDEREFFYKKSRIPLVLNSFLVIITGIYLVYLSSFTVYLFFKIFFAILLLYGFFNCPFYMKKEECEIKKFMYRFGVLILLFLTIGFGVYT